MIALLALMGCPHHAPPPVATQIPSAWVETHSEALAPLHTAYNLASWRAYSTGAEAAYAESAELELAAKKLQSSETDYAQLRAWAADPPEDPLLARQLALLRYDFEENQGPAEALEAMVELANRLDRTFNLYRGEVAGHPLSTNEIADVLSTEADPERRRAAWEASKGVGPLLAEDLRALARLRNDSAKNLGYSNYYEMRLRQQEQDPAALAALLGELASASEAPWQTVKADLDAELSVRFGITPAELRPWHYADPYFQEAPVRKALDMDAYFRDSDVVQLAATTFSESGFAVGEVLARSDLYPREAKQPAAFCLDVDRAGDVRVLANVTPNAYWTSTMLHELGHAVYDLSIRKDLSYLLRAPSHPLTTEAVAMLYGRQTLRPSWIAASTGRPIPEGEAEQIRRSEAEQQLVFMRWALVMANFEAALYANPEQDLQQTWWTLVTKYQGLVQPEGRESAEDWATKIHLISVPVYYHNYILGELMASQMEAAMSRDFQLAPGVSPDLRSPAVREWLVSRIMAPGATLSWDTLISEATGEPLSARYFAEAFLGSTTPPSGP